MFATIAAIAAPVIIVLFMLLFIANLYVRCGSEEILVISGKLFGKDSGKAAKTMHGGGAFVFPLIQQWSKLTLVPFSVEIPLKGALSRNNIRVNVPSTFTVALSPEQSLMDAASQRLIGLSANQIMDQTNEIITGQLRAAIATMSIEEINSDREAFMEAIEKNVSLELNKLGLMIINVNINDITDESGYINAIGKNAAAEAVNKALVDVSKQEREGKIGVATAKREQEVAVAEQDSLTKQGVMQAAKEQRVRVSILEAEAIDGENTAKAKQAEYNATLSEKQAEAKQRSEVAKANAEKSILIAEKERETAKLEKEAIVGQEIAKREKIIKAEAEAEQIRINAKAKADAVWMEKEAEAKGIEAVLKAKADGYKELFATVGENQKHLIPTMEIVKNLPEIVKAQTEAISKIKFDKITVVDGGGNGQGGSGAANFLQSMSRALPSFHEILKTAGVSSPEFLGNLVDESKIIPVKKPTDIV